MGAVYEQFEVELDTCCREAGKPRREMVHLLLLALEREEIVSVGYREAIARRLAGMPIGPQLRELIAHALAWAWKDEEMHAIYLRSAILRLGAVAEGPGLSAPGGRCRGRLVQLPAAARPMPASGPSARFLATMIVGMGGLTGQVPRDVRQHLRTALPRLLPVQRRRRAHRPPLLRTHAGTGPRGPRTLLESRRRPPRPRRRGSARPHLHHPGRGRSTRRTVSRRGDARPGGQGGSASVTISSSRPATVPCLAPARRRWPGLGRRGGLDRGQAAPLPPPAGRRRPGGAAPRPRAGPRPTGTCGWPSSRRSCSPITARIEQSPPIPSCSPTWPNAFAPTWPSSRRPISTTVSSTVGRSRTSPATWDSIPELPPGGPVHRSPHLPARERRGPWGRRGRRPTSASPSARCSHPVEMAHLCVGNVEWIGARCDDFLFPAPGPA